MNRRDFVSRVVLGGAAAACTNFATSAQSAPASNNFKFRFIGMMGFVERQDQSFLVATPGQGHHHMTHVPFLMARAGSPFAKAFGMVPAPGVIPAAFDMQLDGTRPSDFVYRSLDNTSIEVLSGDGDGVSNGADQMAHLRQISPGKRLRGNLEKWASATIGLRGGRLENSAAHPDAGKMWSFGGHRQLLTDAVNYLNDHGSATSIRLTNGSEATTVNVEAGQPAELWMISTTAFDARMNNPTKLVHSELLFEYLVDARPVLAECRDAMGREVPATELPFVRPTSASAGLIASGSAMPPLTDLCFIADLLFNDAR